MEKVYINPFKCLVFVNLIHQYNKSFEIILYCNFTLDIGASWFRELLCIGYDRGIIGTSLILIVLDS